ncbi:MAG: ketoacyl-ACP synthase III [Actinomycetia bacterium]|nr:ketoacyl-ACP synthase III [Actinomycetes bacterium]
MRRAVISGWGRCVPPTVLSNADLEGMMDTSDEWITVRSGIKERRISHVEPSDMAAVASSHALAAAGLGIEDIDLIILASCTSDSVVPATAAHVHRLLDAPVATAAFDLNANCSGFVYSLITASKMIESGMYSRVLVAAAERLSALIDFTDRSTAVLFGDAAGAVVLEPTEEEYGLLSGCMQMDSSALTYLEVTEDGLHRMPERHMEDAYGGIAMNGREVFRRAVVAMGDLSVRAVTAAGLDLDDVDLLIPHQANIRIIDATARRLKLPAHKVYTNIHAYGNTSAATIPVALTEALEQGYISPGSHVVFAAFGGGLTAAAALMRWGERTEPLERSDAVLAPTERSLMELLDANFQVYGFPEKLK